MNSKPDFKTYSYDDLVYAKENIDRDKYPESYEEIVQLLKTKTPPSNLVNESEVQGLGGWLILVGIGVVLGPIRLAIEFLPLYYGIFTDGTFIIVTTPGNEAYHPLWGALLIFEAIYNSLVLAGSVYLAYLFFTKHYFFPKLYIAIALLSLIFIPLDAWFASFVMPNQQLFDDDTLKEFIRSVVTVVIWVPYMLISLRVKNTFIENMPNKSSQQDASEAGASA